MGANGSSRGAADWVRGLVSRAMLVAGLIVGLGVLFSWVTTYIAPNEVGILESRLVPPRGIRPELLPGGRLHFLLPGQTIHRFPTDVQLLELNSGSEGGNGRRSQRVRIEPSVEVNTSDGSRVAVDVTVLFRIENAFTIMQQAGPGRLYENNTLIPKVISALKKNLGEMVAEDFYDVHKRAARQAAAQEQIARELVGKGLVVEHVLVRQYYYNPEYQQQIEEKKIQDQLKFTRQSEGEAAKELAKKQEIEARGKANVAIETERGGAEVTKIQAEADAYRRKRQAEADLVVKLATAQGTELENAAYQGGGSENMVGLEMAQVLKGLDAVVVPSGGKSGFNPLDLEQALDLFDVQEAPKP
ncbi:MAG: SPFH domain-containing protein [bacterium]